MVFHTKAILLVHLIHIMSTPSILQRAHVLQIDGGHYICITSCEFEVFIIGRLLVMNCAIVSQYIFFLNKQLIVRLCQMIS